MAAMIHCADWSAERLPAPQLRGSIGISGLYDLLPLRHTEYQPDLQLSVEEARDLSPIHHQPTNSAPFIVAVGALESSAFQAQSDQLSTAWPRVASATIQLTGRHHYDAPDELLKLTLPLLPTVS